MQRTHLYLKQHGPRLESRNIDVRAPLIIIQDSRVCFAACTLPCSARRAEQAGAGWQALRDVEVVLATSEAGLHVIQARSPSHALEPPCPPLPCAPSPSCGVLDAATSHG